MERERREKDGRDGVKIRAFEKLWKIYYPKLLVYLTHSFSLDEAEAQDLVQDSLLTAYQQFHRYSKNYAMSTWLYSIARNRSIDYLRREGRKQNVRDFPEILDAPGPGPEELYQARATEEEVAAFLTRLSPEEREVAYLRTYEEMGFQEIGRVLGIPAGTARYRMYRVKKKLKKEMENWYE